MTPLKGGITWVITQFLKGTFTLQDTWIIVVFTMIPNELGQEPEPPFCSLEFPANTSICSIICVLCFPCWL